MDSYNKVYMFRNKNTLSPEMKCVNDYNIIFHDILSYIENFLDVLINNCIVIDTTKLNFDNLICMECINTNTNQIIISDTIRFDIKEMVFCGNNDMVYNRSNILNLPLENVKNKLRQVGNIKSKLDEPKIIKYEQKVPEKKETFDVIDPNEILKMIDTLKVQQENETKRLEQLKEEEETKTKKLSKLNNNLGDEKRILHKNKEKEDENKNVFNADKKAYFLIKQDIVSKKLKEDKISVLFKDKYYIFKMMDHKNLLGTDDEYVHYVRIYNELFPKNTYAKDAYIPHNIHYLNEGEKEKYKNIKSNCKDMLDEFMNKNVKPLDQILKEVDNDDCTEGDMDICDNNQFGNVSFDLDL